MTVYNLKKSAFCFRGILSALLAILIWSTMGTTVKLTLSNVDSFTTTFYVTLLSTCILGIYIVMQKKLPILYKEWKNQQFFFIIAGIMGSGIQPISCLKGYQLLPASQVVGIFYIYPLLMTLFAGFWFHERLSYKSILLLMTGFVGVYLLITQNQLLSIQLNFGAFATFIAAATWAFFCVLIQHKKFDAHVGIFLFNGFGMLFLLGLVPAFGLTWTLSITEWLGIIYLAVFTSIIATLLWNQALHLNSTQICSMLALLTPLFALILNMTILHESIVPTQLMGFVILIGSVAFNLSGCLRLQHISGK
ncbi:MULTISPECIES: DMT family transporter [Calothrix]|uniref:DMT family transporter n=2 Tax=Calothrix TaxID=1186 RepID=A0ABR8AJE9_9CYAN|nr:MULTISPECIES: DMT family transporter [Calothrix]MBD2199403.1 DMT family transporter [Calothrix parietina FACHB-288]MBD2228204.1 DMT family transporter [Calothrix anomala FACHB-343]